MVIWKRDAPLMISHDAWNAKFVKEIAEWTEPCKRG